MIEPTIIEKLHLLPERLKEEALHYIEFLSKRYTEYEQPARIPRFGSLKGTFIMNDDFDEPLDDFADYIS